MIEPVAPTSVRMSQNGALRLAAAAAMVVDHRQRRDACGQGAEGKGRLRIEQDDRVVAGQACVVPRHELQIGVADEGFVDAAGHLSLDRHADLGVAGAS